MKRALVGTRRRDREAWKVRERARLTVGDERLRFLRHLLALLANPFRGDEITSLIVALDDQGCRLRAMIRVELRSRRVEHPGSDEWIVLLSISWYDLRDQVYAPLAARSRRFC